MNRQQENLYEHMLKMMSVIFQFSNLAGQKCEEMKFKHKFHGMANTPLNHVYIEKRSRA